MKKLILIAVFFIFLITLLILIGRASCIESIGNGYYLYRCDFDSIKHKKNKEFYLSEVLYIKQNRNIAVGILYPVLRKSIKCKKFIFFIYLKTEDKWFFFCSLKELNQKVRELDSKKFSISKFEFDKANSRFNRRKNLYINE